MGEYEYSCTSKHCELCGHDEVDNVSENVGEDQKQSCEEHEGVDVINPISEDIEKRKDAMDIYCKSDQSGSSRKVLVTDVLQGKDLKDNNEGGDDDNSIDYSEESLVEDSDSRDDDSESET